VEYITFISQTDRLHPSYNAFTKPVVFFCCLRRANTPLEKVTRTWGFVDYFDVSFLSSVSVGVAHVHQGTLMN